MHERTVSLCKISQSNQYQILRLVHVNQAKDNLKSKRLYVELQDDSPTTTRDVMSVTTAAFLRGCVKLKIVQLCVKTPTFCAIPLCSTCKCKNTSSCPQD